MTNCPKCGSNLQELPNEKFHCQKCNKNFHLAYYCKNCGNRIDKHDFEEYDGKCFSCWDNEESDMDEDFGVAPDY